MTAMKPPVVKPPNHQSNPSWHPDRFGVSHDRQMDFDMSAEDGGHVPLPWVSLGLLLGGIAAGIFFSAQNDFLLGQIAAAVVGVSGLHGLWRGGLRKLIMLPVTAGVLFFVVNNPNFADPVVTSIVGKSSPLTNGIAAVATVVLTLVIVGVVVKLVRNRFILKRPFLRGADRFFGTSIGMAEGAFTMLVMCWATVLLEPQARVVRDHPNQVTESVRHRVATGIVQIAEEIQESPFEAFVHENNLLERFPAVRDALYNLGEKNQLDLEALDPGARQQAMDKLRNLDPEMFGPLMDKMEKTHQERDRSYERLPKPRNR